MKKIFTLLSAALMSLAVSAKDYTCNLAVDVFGTPGLEDVTKVQISLNDNANGNYDLVLKDFYFGTMPVGDINIKDIKVVTDDDFEDGAVMLTYNGTITLNGQYAALGPLPATLTGYKAADNVGFKLQIPLVGVNVAAHNMRTQIPGADFENWHEVQIEREEGYDPITGSEPNGWHNIMSGTGNYAALGALSGGNKASSASDDVRKDATGKTSAKVQSSAVFGISANGTITTGRMSVDDFDAKSPKNNVYINPESKDLDSNGDPFYCTFDNYPTSITLWYKFKNGEGNVKPAMINTIITGEGYYQDPEDKKYDNVVARAKMDLPATDEWTKVTIPFEYVENTTAEPTYILSTINTCNEAAGGTSSADNPDVLFVDDVTLNYEPVATEIEFYNEDNDESVTVKLSAGKDTYDVGLNFIPTDEDIDIYCGNEEATALTYYDEATKVLTVNMYNAELKYIKTYKFNIVDPAGINGVESNGSQVVKSRYNVSGQKVGKNARGLIITKYSDGTVKKSFK